jgi:hypothetical protein
MWVSTALHVRTLLTWVYFPQKISRRPLFLQKPNPVCVMYAHGETLLVLFFEMTRQQTLDHSVFKIIFSSLNNFIAGNHTWFFN